MIEVTYISPFQPTKKAYYDYSHNARTILLLAGYLPSEKDDALYINMYTREIARLAIR